MNPIIWIFFKVVISAAVIVAVAEVSYRFPVADVFDMDRPIFNRRPLVDEFNLPAIIETRNG